MRRVVELNNGWVFSKVANLVPSEMPSDWENVTIPHTWNYIDGMDGGNDYHRGICYYANTIEKKGVLPKADQYYLEFEGVNSSATVYVNGNQLGHHDGGYSTFRVNVTNEFMQSENPFVVVEVDNRANEMVYPQKADFTFYGGIYRNVKVVCVKESHFELDDYGMPGLKVTPKEQDGKWLIAVEVFVENVKENQTLTYTIKKTNGCIIESQRVNAKETKVEFVLEDVRLWNGVKDPYMYICEVTLNDKEVIDKVSTKFGCRTFRIDPEEGFFLNGESYPLRGVSRHQDRWQKGNALSKEDHIEDMDLICEMGANSIRLAHYQHDQYFYDLCDERGIVVWAEIPYISKHMPKAKENVFSQMKELIYQNYNHPSIVVWGLSNEITMHGSSWGLLKTHKELNALCHEMDPSRLTTIACLSSTKMNHPYLKHADVISYNHYFGWYGGDVSMNGPWFDAFHRKYPNIPIGCSEYGCEALNWHTSNPTQGDYTEEYQAHYHEELIKQLFTRKYIWSTYVWNMFDFGADARAEGGENGQNHKGLITIDRKYKKDSFYAYKAWLSDEPFVHICGKRYVDRVEALTRVTVYSNQPEVELYVDGLSMGKQISDEHFFYFDVPNVGETTLEAVAGECRDVSMIRKVDAFNEEYRLPEANMVLNWFDVETANGYLSINDTVGEIISTLRGKIALGMMIAKISKQAKKGNSSKAMVKMSSGKENLKMLEHFTVLRLASMAESFVGVEVSKEQLLELNAKLSKIKKRK